MRSSRVTGAVPIAAGRPSRAVSLDGDDGGPGDDVGLGTLSGDRSVDHDRQPVALDGFVHGVGGDEHTDSGRSLPSDHLPQFGGLQRPDP